MERKKEGKKAEKKKEKVHFHKYAGRHLVAKPGVSEVL